MHDAIDEQPDIARAIAERSKRLLLQHSDTTDEGPILPNVLNASIVVETAARTGLPENEVRRLMTDL